MVNVLLSSEKAIIRLDPTLVDLPTIRQAVSGAGNYMMLDTTVPPVARPIGNFTRRILTLFGVVFGAVLFMVIVGNSNQMTIK